MFVILIVAALWTGMHSTLEAPSARVPSIDFGPASTQFLEDR